MCKVTQKGLEYTGKVATTTNGKTCQQWALNTPHDHGMNTADYYPDSTVPDNFCRNPDKGTYGPWCYTTDPDDRWQVCNVKFCDEC